MEIAGRTIGREIGESKGLSVGPWVGISFSGILLGIVPRRIRY